MDIDSIDITDSAFSLDVPEINNIAKAVGGSDSYDYTMFIYIGLAVVALIIGMFIYKSYQNKTTNQMCEGGFCNMNDEYNETPQNLNQNQNQHQNQNQNQYI